MFFQYQIGRVFKKPCLLAAWLDSSLDYIENVEYFLKAEI